MKKSSIVSNKYRGASLCCINSFLYDLYLGMFFYEWYVEWALSGGLAHYQCVFAAAVLCYWRTGHSLAQGKQNTGEPILPLCFYVFVCLLVLLYVCRCAYFLSVCLSLLTDKKGTLYLARESNTQGEPILGPSCLLRLTCPESQECLWDQIDGAKLPFTEYDGGHQQKNIWHTITAHTLGQISAFHVTVIVISMLPTNL